MLEVHHIVSRQVGGDRPRNLVTLCKTCHERYHQGKLKLDFKPLKSFKAETFMSIVRWKVVNTLRETGNTVSHTYGYITKHQRIALGLPKSHIDDAFVIAGSDYQQKSKVYYFIRQVRKCNRKLFKGIRSHIRNIAKRYIKGFQRYDKVSWHGIECFIFGRRKTGYFDLRKLDGTKIHATAKASELKLLERVRTFLVERMERRFLPSLMEGISAAKI